MEIPTESFSRAVAFYQAVLNIDIEEVDMDGVKMGVFPSKSVLKWASLQCLPTLREVDWRYIQCSSLIQSLKILQGSLLGYQISVQRV